MCTALPNENWNGTKTTIFRSFGTLFAIIVLLKDLQYKIWAMIWKDTANSDATAKDLIRYLFRSARDVTNCTECFSHYFTDFFSGFPQTSIFFMFECMYI